MITLITIAAASAMGAGPIDQADRCLIVRYAPDGSRTERRGDPGEFGVDVSHAAHGGQTSVATRSTGSSSHSSVSASSSTSGAGQATTTSTRRVGDRTISLHTQNGECTVVIDDRPAVRRTQ